MLVIFYHVLIVILRYFSCYSLLSLGQLYINKVITMGGQLGCIVCHVLKVTQTLRLLKEYQQAF